MNKCRTRSNLARGLFYALSFSVIGWAQAEVVVVVGANNPVGSLNKERTSDIYLGKDTTFTPLDQPASSPLRDEFYSKIAGKSAAQAKSHWSKLSFTGKGTPPKEGRNSDDIKRQVSDNPKLIGYIDKSDVDSSVKVLFAAQ